MGSEQLLAHLWGDYILQSDWMAQNKTKANFPAMVHAIVYSLTFLLFHPRPLAFAVILLTHFLIDRFRLARYVVWAKNCVGPRHWNPAWEHCTKTGYDDDSPIWMSLWLLIIADNILHLTINYAALRWL